MLTNQRPYCINLFAACGVGKSRTMAAIFNRLKYEGIDAEMAPEFAKITHYENMWPAMSDAWYLLGNMERQRSRLIGHCQVIVTDCPAGMESVYMDNPSERAILEGVVKQVLRPRYDNCDFRLLRDTTRPYQQSGRRQTLEDSLRVDERVEPMMGAIGAWPSQMVLANEDAGDAIVDYFLKNVWGDAA